MNLDLKEQFFYVENKRCKVAINNQYITIQNELTPNIQTVINLSDLINIKLCTCLKTPTKLICKCIQNTADKKQENFINPTFTKNIINGNFEQSISFVHADGAFDSTQQFQLRKINSTLTLDSKENSEEEFLKNNESLEDEESDGCIDENLSESNYLKFKKTNYEDKDINSNNDLSNISKKTKKSQINQAFKQDILLNQINNKITKNLKEDYLDEVLFDNNSNIDNSKKSFIKDSIKEIDNLDNYVENKYSSQLSIRCLRIFYCVPYSNFNYKIKFINLIPEYLKNNLSSSTLNEDIKYFNEQKENFKNLKQQSNLKLFDTAYNQVLQQKKILQLISFVKNRLQEFNRPKSLLLFINPVGGKKKSPIIYKKICQPILTIASIKVHAIYTQKANHAYQLLRDENVDLSYYESLGCVGGDGMFSEILNGILKRNKNNQTNSTNNAQNNVFKNFQKDTISSNFDNSIEKKQELKKNESFIKTEKIGSNNQFSNSNNHRLGFRYSLPCTNDTSLNWSDELKKIKNNKRNSLPVNSLKNKSNDLNQEILPLLIIPGGSTDAVSYATNGINDPQTAIINFVLGKKIKLDIAAVHSVEENNRLIKYCSSFLGYGYFGDILRDSEENLKWMGPKRYDWAGLKKFFLHKIYKGELNLKVSLLDGNPKNNDLCLSNCQLCSKSYIRNLFNLTDSIGYRKISLSEIIDTNKLTKNINLEEDNNNNDLTVENFENDLVVKNINLKNSINFKESNEENTSVICIKGRFLAINAATLSCRCGHSKYGISPSQHTGNGCVDLIVIAQCTRKDYLKYLIRTGFSEKSPFDLDFVNVYRVKEFTFKPIVDENQDHVSVWNCDGEILNEPAINVKIHCQLVTVFGNGIEIRPNNKTLIRREKLQNLIKYKIENSIKNEIPSSNGLKKMNFKNLETDFSKIHLKKLAYA